MFLNISELKNIQFLIFLKKVIPLWRGNFANNSYVLKNKRIEAKCSNGCV